LLCSTAQALEEEIDRDLRFPGGLHRLGNPLRIVADDIIVDLGDAQLEGARSGGDPDEFVGIGLLLEGRKRVTIRGGRLRGFRCAVLLRDCEEVVLDGLDVSGNYRQRLRSTPEREFGGDWLWPHENDAQQWRRNYGAGVCLERCRRCIVRACTGRRQQNGLILDRCTECEVYDNDMSFNSGWGVALWRSSQNVVSRNNLDWCVRGYSHGIYDRGQDSAGILVFEQCHANRFLANSATHGGDGFFLFAGNETLKRTGRGGCNDNLVWGNDFSHAVANGIEATFSARNHFRENRCDDCNYGIWAGYSYASDFEGNTCRDNRIAGIAIEHGESNFLLGNHTARNPRGIWLWWDEDRDLLASEFAKVRGCASRKYVIQAHTFERDMVGISLRDTSSVRLVNNVFHGVGREREARGDCSEVGPGVEVGSRALRSLLRGDAPGSRDVRLPAGHPRGMRHIRIDEWGPLDPAATSVYPRTVTAWGACTFHVLGPEAGYKVAGLPAGLEIEKGTRTFRVTGGLQDITEFTAEVHVGGEIFPVRGLLLRAEWRVRFWPWKRDPREDADAWAAMLASEPAHTRTVGSLDYTWAHRAPADGVPADRFATRAETTMSLPAGRYEVRTVSDDGVRVRIDGREVQADWTWHGPEENRSVVDLEAGAHSIVVEHFEIDGYAVLRFDLRPVK
jgi:parallel beta-helix repeat protein